MSRSVRNTARGAARVLAVSFALTVAGYLVIREQRAQNAHAVPAAETREALATVGQSVSVFDEAAGTRMLPSSKALVLGEGRALEPAPMTAASTPMLPVEPDPAFLFSSKSLGPTISLTTQELAERARAGEH